MVKYHSIIQLWKIIRMKKPECMTSKFKIEDDDLLSTNSPRLQFTSNGFRWRTTKDWNNLPKDIREIKSLAILKRRPKSWIIELRSAEPEPD